MNLLKFNYYHTFYIFVNDQFRNGMLMSTMSITETNLLIIILVEANGRLVEELYIVLKSDPENTIHFIINS